jgi:integrase
VKLTTAAIAGLALPPGKSDEFFWDEEIPGLGVRVRSSGRRLWVFQFRVGARQRRMTLGRTSAISAADARKLASQLYAKTRLGVDPAGDKIELQARMVETFGAAVALYLTRQKNRLRPASYVAVERHLLKNARDLHRLPLAKVDRRAIAALLAKTAATIGASTTNRVRDSLSGFFAFAIREGLAEANPVIGTELREEVGRERLLADSEVAAIWAALGDDTYGDIVRLLILLGLRRAEVGGLRWSEIDLDRGLISIPPERVKNGRPHVVALNAPAVAILRARPRNRETVFGRGSNGFNAWGDGKARLDRDLRAAGVSPFVLHDFRRYLSTTMHERLGVAPHVVEAVLGHVGHQAGVAGRYNKSIYLAEKAQAMARWADHIRSITEGGERKVVPLRI